jgi:uncharacterized protein with beta-barrel porin domain
MRPHSFRTSFAATLILVQLLLLGISVSAATPDDDQAALPDSNTRWETQAKVSPQTSDNAAGLPSPAQTVDLGPWRLWQAVFAGRSELAGNPQAGTQNVIVSLVGTAIGADTAIGTVGLIGGSISIDQQTFSSGTGHGRSHDVTATLYGRRTIFDRAYMIAAVSYGWHSIATKRVIPGFETDPLTAVYQAQDLGGRLETGYSFTLPDLQALTPYTAIVGDAFHQPAYSESGLPIFSALFAAKTIGIGHTELGTRYAKIFTIDASQTLAVDALTAWNFELDSRPYVLAAFQSAPDTKFPVFGTTPAKSTALMGSGARFKSGAFTIGARGDARIGSRTTIFSGTADLTIQW